MMNAKLTAKKFEIESSDSGDDSKNNDHPIKGTPVKYLKKKIKETRNN
jgi:hypothetical protein